jgi:hypothetical protein
MVARNTNVPFKGRIQKLKTHDLQIIIFGLQRAAGPYRWALADSCSAANNYTKPPTSLQQYGARCDCQSSTTRSGPTLT